MRLLHVFTLGLLWLVTVATDVQAAGRRGCCTRLVDVRPEMLTKARGKVRCRWQGITEGCNINAVVLKLKGRQICVNPRPRKLRKLLKMWCSNTATGKMVRKPGQRKRRRTKG